jgi:hypothetical protein
MIRSHMRTKLLTVAISGIFCGSSLVQGATVNAASCAQSAVQTAVNAAADADTVAVPAGACTWTSGITLTKGVRLQGAGASAVTINMGAGGYLNIIKNASYIIEVSGFTFNNTGTTRVMTVSGAWTGEPPLIHDNVFNVTGSSLIRYETNGGVIYRNVFNGTTDDSGIQHKNPNDTESWSTADTMGTRDIDGKRNLYVEDNVFNGMANQATDFDDASRVVFRYNTLNNSSFNSHGLDTSPVGIRHFEIYKNSFRQTDKSVNQSWFIWLRGGTGVIYENAIDDLNGQMWGNKNELFFSVRAANDGAGAGCCTSYACKHQVGQNSSGTGQYTDPVQLWSNSGTLAWTINEWSNTCGQNINNYLQPGRDFVFGSSAKAGYAAYAYPHPLRASNGTTPPLLPAPANLRLQ